MSQRFSTARATGILMLLSMLVIAACGDEPEAEPPDGPSPASLSGVYTGIFPCANCSGIRTTLWLRDDGRFFIEQSYGAGEGDGDEESAVYNLGRWRWTDARHTFVLEGDGPQRVFDRAGDGAVSMRTATGIEHRLERVPDAPDFTATIGMKGTMSADGGWNFAECLTGLAVPVSKDGEFRRFAHQYRSAGAGKPVFVELDGHFAWTADGAPASVTIDRFLTIREEGACPPGN